MFRRKLNLKSKMFINLFYILNVNHSLTNKYFFMFKCVNNLKQINNIIEKCLIRSFTIKKFH